MNADDFAKVKAKTADLLAITEKNLYQKSIELMNAFNFYFTRYTAEYRDFQNLLADKKQMYGKLYNKFRYDSNHEQRTVAEIESFVYSDDDFYKLCLKINDQEMVVKYLEGISDTIKRLSYNIKNIIELKQLGMQA